MSKEAAEFWRVAAKGQSKINPGDWVRELPIQGNSSHLLVWTPPKNYKTTGIWHVSPVTSNLLEPPMISSHGFALDTWADCVGFVLLLGCEICSVTCKSKCGLMFVFVGKPCTFIRKIRTIMSCWRSRSNKLWGCMPGIAKEWIAGATEARERKTKSQTQESRHLIFHISNKRVFP